jgi:hypothetical protein
MGQSSHALRSFNRNQMAREQYALRLTQDLNFVRCSTVDPVVPGDAT